MLKKEARRLIPCLDMFNKQLMWALWLLGSTLVHACLVECGDTIKMVQASLEWFLELLLCHASFHVTFCTMATIVQYVLEDI